MQIAENMANKINTISECATSRSISNSLVVGGGRGDSGGAISKKSYEPRPSSSRRCGTPTGQLNKVLAEILRTMF